MVDATQTARQHTSPHRVDPRALPDSCRTPTPAEAALIARNAELAAPRPAAEAARRDCPLAAVLLASVPVLRPRYNSRPEELEATARAFVRRASVIPETAI